MHADRGSRSGAARAEDFAASLHARVRLCSPDEVTSYPGASVRFIVEKMRAEQLLAVDGIDECRVRRAAQHTDQDVRVAAALEDGHERAAVGGNQVVGYCAALQVDDGDERFALATRHQG